MKNSLASTCSIKSYIPVMLPLAALCFVAGCSDPASDVHKSSGTAPQQPAAEAPAATKDFTITEDSKIAFVGSKVTGSHEGGFKKFSGSLKVANGKVIGSSEILIQMDSTFSDSDRLTGHLKSKDFFDTAQFPTATFTVTSIEGINVTGNLNLHGVTKSISFPADIQVSADSVTVKADFAIKRKEFNIMYAGKADDLIRDDVVLKLDVKAIPAAGA